MAKTVSLEVLLRGLSTAFVDLEVAPHGADIPIESVALVDSADLAAENSIGADLYLLVGVSEADVLVWFDTLILGGPAPGAIMTKTPMTDALRHAAHGSGVALISVHHQTRWERLLSAIRSVLGHAVVRVEPVADGLFGADTDLYGLAQTVASLTEGMVSIEDERSHVLAYSASDDAADELRTLSILGREGPADYLRRLRELGIFDRLRRTDDVIEVPADDDYGIRRRMVVGIRRAGAATNLGSIWLQEGSRPIASDADVVLRGAAAVAARLIARIIDAPTNEALQIQRLLGAHGGGVDVPSLAAALAIETTGPAAVIGFAALGQAVPIGGLAASLRLHASAFRRDSLVTTIGERIYVLIPHMQSQASVTSWTRDAVERIEVSTSRALRAVVAAPVSDLGVVQHARFEVDRVLDGTVGEQRVTTLADSRTSVLLREIVDLIGAHAQLLDPRIEVLLAYDEKTGSSLCDSLEVYLDHVGDVRAAADTLHVHPNTLRYRVKRVEKILGLDLADPDTRLLVELQLRVRKR